MSRPSTVTLNATRRFSDSVATSPEARPARAGESGISVPMRPSAGPARTSRRVRSSRRMARKSWSASALDIIVSLSGRPHSLTKKASVRAIGALQATCASVSRART